MSVRRGRELEELVRSTLVRYRDIEVDTNLFEGGFTSGMLADVLAALKEAGLNVALVDLYRHPTIRALTVELRRRALASAARPDDRGGAVPWTNPPEFGG